MMRHHTRNLHQQISNFKSNLTPDHTNLIPKAVNFLTQCNTQISENGRNGNIGAAETIFHRMPRKNTVTWTAMLTAYAQNGQITNARKMFDEMPERTTASYNAMISAYIRNGCNVTKAYEIFSTLDQRNMVSYAAMITGFVKAGKFHLAEKLYLEAPCEFRDPACSNALINGYLKKGETNEALRELEVNKIGTFGRNFQNKFLFRKGEIGDYTNHLSPTMVEKLSKVMEEKLGGSGLSFRVK